jgi:hypothetical protein
MKALQNIQNEAKVIVEQLAEREVSRMKDNYNLFEVWLAGAGNPIMNHYENNKINMYESIAKYVYMNHFSIWNRELRCYEKPLHYPSEHHQRREMYSNKECSNMMNELRLMISPLWEARYRELFIAQNMMKLNRALAKHLNDNMSASDIRVNIGGDGAEVLAGVDGKLFKTFGTLCGGFIQCLHYRYRSSLK